MPSKWGLWYGDYGVMLFFNIKNDLIRYSNRWKHSIINDALGWRVENL